jgi:hypothetical protein
MRWKIETFHKILKSGCKAADSKLRTADRLASLISVFCILSWRIFWLTMISRCAPQAAPDTVFTATEIELPGRLLPDLPLTAQAPPRLRNLIRVARLGGYLARASNAPRAIPLCGAACSASLTFNPDMNSPSTGVGNCKQTCTSLNVTPYSRAMSARTRLSVHSPAGSVGGRALQQRCA